ncbi:hypothetical protein NLI96_g7806 [Meripilus lineatus]|uniref:Uncharacterized protein n=1 Tax=Meripilus lineatus TaxID=2056292 RepID=A0AAD5UYI9_9APHY|nr:hypothetical protein NLI96_g7806 [Physisporinus lineatus]
MLRWLANKVSVAPLHEFHLYCDKLKIESQYLCEIVQRSSASLKKIELSFDTLVYKGDYQDVVLETTWLPSIATCVNLQDLRLETIFTKETSSCLISLLPFLPSSICSLALGLWSDGDTCAADSTEETFPFLRAVDDNLASSRFPKLNYVEIRWGGRWLTDGLEDNIVKLHQRGVFKKALPKIYERGILWCGHCKKDVVYSITEQTLRGILRVPG